MRSWVFWSAVLGFALGGFFDGILLHQILQWHHLLSLVPGVESLRVQVLWDGLFHALMYLIAVLAIWRLWRSRAQAQHEWGRSFAGALLIGFGIWNVLDIGLAHWIVGIHRVRLDSPNPLLWDLIWIVAFGILPSVVGWLLLRNGRGQKSGRLHPTTIVVSAGLVSLSMAAWSLRPPPSSEFTTVVFAPAVKPAEVMKAVVAANARLVWSDPKMTVVVLDVPPANRWGLYAKGALLVSGSGLPAACFNWSKGYA